MPETITIDRLAYGDAGIGRAENGKTVFVNGACPGDVALVEIDRDKGNFCEGHVVELVAPSPDRVLPACPLASVCGGCGWQHISYVRQLAAKRDAVVSQLRRIGGFDAERAERIVGACVPSKRQMEYRNKLEFSCAFDAKQGFQMGFHQKGSDKILAADACPLAHKQAQKTPKALRGALRYLTGREDLGIHRVGVRHSHRSGDLEVALWTTPGPFPRNAVAKTLSTAVKASSIVRVMTADAGSARKLKGLEILDGRGFWRETVAGIEHGVSAPSFFQVNTPQADKLVQLALDGLELDEDCVAADLFCGVGTFTIPLAKRCGGVYAVESYGSSVRNLRHTVEQENVDVEVIGGDATRELPELGELDALIVDPPRSGLAKEIIGSIAEAAPLRVAYVSCDPATWARDVKLLEAAGFELLQATPVDMFPQTFHVETVAVLTREKSVKSYAYVNISPSELGMGGKVKEPTYKQIQEYVLKNHGLKVSSLYIANLKDELGLDKQFSYEEAEMSAEKRPKCPPEKREAILDAFRHFGLIGEDETEK